MSDYDFSTLHDKEFEALVADLVGADEGVRVELFKPGKDLGIDGRWYADDGGACIIQCKQWRGSGISALLSAIRSKEVAKVHALMPKRYIFATNVPLSPKNKAAIADIFSPYIRRHDDILGPDDLNALLRTHTSVERQHYKLWLSSTTVLTELLNNAIVGRSRAVVEEIVEEAPLYAPTIDHTRAFDHLSEHRVLILTGEPGIGKTMLARQLLLQHQLHGFTPFVIEQDIGEAEDVFDAEQKQFFLFDDFLGTTYLESLRAKQDSHTDTFLKRVARSRTKRMVLTSRTNILNQGRSLSETLAAPRFGANEFALRVTHLADIDKGRILYNHLWHSGLGDAYVDELYADRRYREVVLHDNFNPRLVAFVLRHDRAMAMPPEDYWPYVSYTLNHPETVWKRFFQSQLTQQCRDLAFLVVLNGDEVSESDLQRSYFALHVGKDKGLVYNEFAVASEHATGSVLNRTIRTRGGEAYYSIFNPSIADYVLDELQKSALWSHYIPAIRTVGALAELEQLRDSEKVDESTYVATIERCVTSLQIPETLGDAYDLRLCRLIVELPQLRDRMSSELSWWISDDGVAAGGVHTRDFLTVLRDLMDRGDVGYLQSALERLPELLEVHHALIGKPQATAALLSKLRVMGMTEHEARIRAQILSEWEDQVDVVVDEGDLLGEYSLPSEVASAIESLYSVIQERLEEAGVSPVGDEIADILEKVDVEQVLEANRVRYLAEDAENESWEDYYRGSSHKSDDLDDLFDRSALG